MNPEIPKGRLCHEEPLRGGQMWSRVIKRGQVLRVVDVEGGATPCCLLFNAHQPLERYNMPDTLKAQHIMRLTEGYVLYSDMGRILLSVTRDTAGWHDTVTGHMTAAQTLGKYGEGTYQECRNEFQRNSRDNLLIELGKHGLGARDLGPTLNLFTKVVAADDGTLSYQPQTTAGQFIDLRAEMDVLCVLSNTPHALDPSPSYAPRPLQLLVYQADPVASDDPCRTKRPENERGFILTEAYHR